MALHGSVMVNDAVIGYWTATRQEEFTGPNREYRYRWRYQQNLDDGTHFGFEGEVMHVYQDKAPALIAKIMQAVNDKLATFS